MISDDDYEFNVEIGTGSPRAVFRSDRRVRSADPYTGSSFIAELHDDGLAATQSVFVFSFDWDALAAFFEDLAESWKGWEGERAWHSIEHHLAISATSDPLGHCNFQFTLQNGPDPTWKTTLAGFRIDAGEDMAATAREVRAWVQDMVDRPPTETDAEHGGNPS